MNIEFTDEFEEWFNSLADKPRKRVTKIVDMLDMMGQGLLGTKYAKSIVGSENLFELVIQVGGQPYRILYGLINASVILLLIGANKKGDDRFYKREIPCAEAMILDWISKQ